MATSTLCQVWADGRKMLKHWAQSWLLGVPTIEVGFRDEAGILQSRTTFETGRIPRLSVQPLRCCRVIV